MADSYEKQLHWKAYKDRKVAEKVELQTQRDLQECTFAPRINSSLSSNKSLGDMPSIDDESGSDDEALRTRSARGKDFEVDSIQLHIERQQQARAQVEFAKRRVSTEITKNFKGSTKQVPFQLSSGTKPKKLLPSKRVTISSSKDLRLSSPVRRISKAQDKFVELLEHPHNEKQPLEVEEWLRERATLVSIIEGQREDLKHREQAQAQAAKIAKRFATAVLAFEERLVQVEERSQNEIEGLKQQIAQQSTNIDKILKILTHKADLATENN